MLSEHAFHLKAAGLIRFQRSLIRLQDGSLEAMQPHLVERITRARYDHFLPVPLTSLRLIANHDSMLSTPVAPIYIPEPGVPDKHRIVCLHCEPNARLVLLNSFQPRFLLQQRRWEMSLSQLGRQFRIVEPGVQSWHVFSLDCAHQNAFAFDVHRVVNSENISHQHKGFGVFHADRGSAKSRERADRLGAARQRIRLHFRRVLRHDFNLALDVRSYVTVDRRSEDTRRRRIGRRENLVTQDSFYSVRRRIEWLHRRHCRRKYYSM